MKRRVSSPSRNHLALLLAWLLSTPALARPAGAQEPRWDAGAELTVSRLGSLEETAAGVGVRLSFRIADWLAADGGVTLAPGDLGAPPFNASQTEVLAGLRVGPRADPVGGFAALRGGLVSFAEAPEPLVCIAIFPPPLTCRLARGTTVFAGHLGAGVELLAGKRGLFRLEVGDRIVKLPGPALDPGGEFRDGDFWSHDLRFAVSAGFRF